MIWPLSATTWPNPTQQPHKQGERKTQSPNPTKTSSEAQLHFSPSRKQRRKRKSPKVNVTIISSAHVARNSIAFQLHQVREIN